MMDLNVPGNQASSAFMQALLDLGVDVTLYNNSVHATGDEAQLAAAQALSASFDHAAGAFADLAKRYEIAVQAHLDAEARAHGYDSILSACSYAGYTNPYQAEGNAFLAWRGNVWAYCYAQLGGVQAGTREQPSIEAFLTELPALSIP